MYEIYYVADFEENARVVGYSHRDGSDTFYPGHSHGTASSSRYIQIEGDPLRILGLYLSEVQKICIVTRR